MEVGTENRTKLIAAIALGVVAIALLGNWLLGSSGTPTTAATTPSPMVTPLQDELRAASPSRSAHGKKAATAPRSLDPTLRFAWLRSSEDTEYKGTGRNIFMAQVEIPAPIVNPATDKKPQGPAPPPAPPPPPPIDLKFFGFASRPGEPKKIFLSQGEDVFIATEGDIIDRRYKVLRIYPMSVEIEDVLNNNRQQIPLTQG
jgi:hypothetical protein